MSVYILDTDTLTLYRQGRSLLVERVNAQPLSAVATTVINVEEQLSGWQALLRQSKSDAHLAQTYLRLTETVRAFPGFTFSPSRKRRSPATVLCWL